VKKQQPGVVAMPVILALGRLRQEDLEFKVSLDYIAPPYLKETNKQTSKQATNQPTKY
jgi:hypothetical protein